MNRQQWYSKRRLNGGSGRFAGRWGEMPVKKEPDSREVMYQGEPMSAQSGSLSWESRGRCQRDSRGMRGTALRSLKYMGSGVSITCTLGDAELKVILTV